MAFGHSLKMARPLICIALAVLSSWIVDIGGTNAQSCYSWPALGSSRWKFTPIYVRNNSSAASSSVSAARGAWNSLSQPFLVAAYGDFGTSQTDIFVQDATGDPNYVGQTAVSGGSGCDGWDACSNCYHITAVISSVTITLNMTAISGLVIQYSKSQSQVEQTIMAHELGHALVLGDVSSSHFLCDSSLSIMDPSAPTLLNCNMTGPRACDATNVQNYYYDTGGPNSYCAGTCSYGSC